MSKFLMEKSAAIALISDLWQMHILWLDRWYFSRDILCDDDILSDVSMANERILEGLFEALLSDLWQRGRCQRICKRKTRQLAKYSLSSVFTHFRCISYRTSFFLGKWAAYIRNQCPPCGLGAYSSADLFSKGTSFVLFFQTCKM